jgi:hypothetical protein
VAHQTAGGHQGDPQLRDRCHRPINESRYGEVAARFTPDAVVELGYLTRYEGNAAIDKGFHGMGKRERFFINSGSRLEFLTSTRLWPSEFRRHARTICRLYPGFSCNNSRAVTRS